MTEIEVEEGGSKVRAIEGHHLHNYLHAYILTTLY